MTTLHTLLASFVLCASLAPVAFAAESVGRVTGVGGIFFTSKNPKALMAWYRDILGIKIESWGGAVMSYDAPNHPPVMILSAFDTTTNYMSPSTREFMLNLAVDNLAVFVDRLKAKGIDIIKQDDSDPNGKFAWILDPDGTKIELWEPKVDAASK